MSGNFWIVRGALKDALGMRCAELVTHRKKLHDFEVSYALLDETTPAEVADDLHRQIEAETKQVEWIETQIRDIERTLEKYGLKPASVA